MRWVNKASFMILVQCRASCSYCTQRSWKSAFLIKSPQVTPHCTPVRMTRRLNSKVFDNFTLIITIKIDYFLQWHSKLKITPEHMFLKLMAVNFWRFQVFKHVLLITSLRVCTTVQRKHGNYGQRREWDFYSVTFSVSSQLTLIDVGGIWE